MSLSISLQPLIAQEGSQAAADVVQNALTLSRNVSGSWNGLWASLLTDTSEFSLWSAIVRFALTIAVFALIYYAVSQANNVFNTQSFSKIVEMFVAPIVVVALLGGNGRLLAQIILMIRGVGHDMISQILGLQLAGLSLNNALAEVNGNLMAMQRIRQVFSECAALTGDPLIECLASKQAEAEAIVDALSQQGTQLRSVSAFLATLGDYFRGGAVGAAASTGRSFIEGGFTQVIQDTLVPILQVIISAIQIAFANILEAALLLTALFAPIAVVMLLVPAAGNALAIWFTGFLRILAIQLGYTLTVGIFALVLVQTDEQNVLASAGAFTFLIFIAFFAPALAVMVGNGGGSALYEGISRKAAQAGQAAVQVVAAGIKMGAGFF